MQAFTSSMVPIASTSKAMLVAPMAGGLTQNFIETERLRLGFETEPRNALNENCRIVTSSQLTLKAD